MRRRLDLATFLVTAITIAGCAMGTDEGSGASGPADTSSGPHPVLTPDDTGDPNADTGATDAATDAMFEVGSDGGCSTSSDCSSLSSKPGASTATCTSGACVMTCDPNHYDVNGDPTDGCEVADVCGAQHGSTTIDPACGPDTTFPIENHTQANAAPVGSFPCNDGSSQQNITGVIPSDNRAHSPTAESFDPVTGSAPDYYKIDATGGTCTDDANFDLQMNAPTAQLGCYELHLLTNKNGGQSCQTDTTGHCSITNGSGSYGDGSTIYVWVQKNASCTADKTADDAPYTITGHL